MLQYKIMRKIAFLAVDLGELKIANYYCEKINQIDTSEEEIFNNLDKLISHTYLPLNNYNSLTFMHLCKKVSEKSNIKVEYMDTKAVKYNSVYKEKLYDLYVHKYKNKNFDLIVTTDDNALNFVHKYYEKIFKG